ncbi:DUF2607 family protein [Vibrio sp. Y2-5]|uniref:DUF2607 family protein n=1 Tax=Vibrio sp. Y2-5 TaxID=2743977 RepID=UPI0016609346|nr:DUF2607 family protein [Vibrio sp. Y2-5]MBD0787767.1 DUF2607 family protein [Vibrio sp. Y2-5]
MFSNLHSLRIKAKIVAIPAILLMVWLNIAFIEHQLDASPAHHSEHHCQLFACANQALAQHIPELPVWVSHNYLESVTQPSRLSILHLAYLARSPPTPA